MSPLLTVSDLTVSADGTELVHPTSLTIDRGERVGLIGESGSGKSLTAAAIMGLLPAQLSATGSIDMDGVDGNLLAASERSRAALRGKVSSMVFQEPMSALNPLHRVGAQVAETMTLHGSSRTPARARALELLDQVGLPDPRAAARAYPHQLSGGQRQRVVLAIALANSPELLICDEPTTALDVTVQAQVLDLIRESVARENAGLLFITHDLAVVAEVCQRVLVMHDGRVVESGQVAEVFAAPQHPYTRGLLAASDLRAVDERGRLYTIETASQRELPPRAADSAQQPEPSLSRGSAPASRDHTATEAPAAEAAVGETVTSSASAEPLIDVHDLHKVYRRTRSLWGKPDEVQALTDVSFSVPAGGRFGIVGESGSGKSTLLRILAGLETASTGTARVAGVEVVGAAESQLRAMRRSTQIVFQDPYASLDPRMTVEQIVAEPLVDTGAPGAERRARAAATLADVGLGADALRRYPHQFSGGQRQRISIARALAVRPQILIADEPVSALDVSVRAQVLNLLADLADDYQLTLVFVSHDLGVVRHLCRDVMVMRSGRVVESGPVDEIYQRPREEYTAGLIAATPVLPTAR